MTIRCVMSLTVDGYSEYALAARALPLTMRIRFFNADGPFTRFFLYTNRFGASASSERAALGWNCCLDPPPLISLLSKAAVAGTTRSKSVKRSSGACFALLFFIVVNDSPTRLEIEISFSSLLSRAYLASRTRKAFARSRSNWQTPRRKQ